MLANLNLRRGIVLGMLSVLLGGFAPLYAAPIDPPLLKGIKIHPDNPLQFDFIVSRGTEDAPRLIKYFLASLTVPEKDLWVNLSPYEKDRIVPESFGQTEMGRDLLAQDYMLKQITASLIYPEGETGKKFWERVYAQAAQKFGTTNIPVNTFNKVWIVPDKAEVYENAKAGTAYVVVSTLKVMLESDYLAASKSQTQDTASDALAKQVLREIVIPQLTKEVNEGRNFAQLRQVYNSLILATWYKKKIKDSVLARVYADKNKVAGISISDPREKQKIYERYLQAFKKGAYDYIKEEQDPSTGQMVPRKYFSGGASLNLIASVFGVSHDPAALPRTGLDHAMTVQVDLQAVTAPVLDDLNRALVSDGGVPNVDKIVSVLWIEVIKGGDEVWQNGPDGKGSMAEQAFELVFRSIDDHHDQWVRKSKQVFDELLGEFFEEQDLPRLYAMHRAVWRHSPELGLRMLDDSIEHILQFYHAARLQKGVDFENYAHTMVDTLYLLKQIEIAQQALGWEKLRAGITSLPAIDRSSILTLLGDGSHPEDLVPDSNLPLKEFIRHIRDFINSPAGRTLQFMQDRLADAVTGYGQKYARALEEAQGLLTGEKVGNIADLTPGDMVKVKLKDDPAPVLAFVADDYQSSGYGQGYFLMSFNLVDQIDLDAGKGLLFFKRENKTSQARIDSVSRLRPSRADAAMVADTTLTAPDGAVFTFEHYVEGTRVREHRIEAFSNGRKIGYIHFSVLPGQNGGAIAWMQRAFQPYDRTDGYNGHGAAIFVEPEMTASSQGSYHGIARSLLGMAERTAFGEGARKFQAQEVSRANFNNFYHPLGYADAGESQAYGKDITVVKELNENTFAALGIGTEKGGIDFDPGKIDLRVRNSGGEMGSSIDPALLERLQGVSGFAPVIVHVQPLEDLRLFLGVTD